MIADIALRLHYVRTATAVYSPSGHQAHGGGALTTEGNLLMTTDTIIQETDRQLLIKRPNDLLAKYHARVYIEDVPEKILEFYEANAAQIQGEVLIVRSKQDEGFAAFRRNCANKALFLFGRQYWVDSYFSDTCQRILLPKPLLSRYRD